MDKDLILIIKEGIVDRIYAIRMDVIQCILVLSEKIGLASFLKFCL